MKNLYYNLVSILIVIIILFNSAGFLIIFLQLKHNFKKEAFSKIETLIPLKELERISVGKDDLLKDKIFQRIEEREFRYKGKMYDISSEIITEDSVVFYCINDKNEECLHAAFAKYFTDLNSPNTTSQKSGLRLLMLETTLNVNHTLIYPLQVFEYHQLSKFVKNSFFTDIPSPPPEMVA